MASQYYNVTTNNGDAKIANAIATATKLNITHVVFGDGNGSVPTPDKSRTALVNEVYRVAPSNYYLHPTIANRLIVEAIIPSNIGGFYIREVGLIADTTVLISDGSVAPIFKEASTDGTREYKLKFAINIVDSSIANITLDSSLIYVTQNTIVDNLTTADASKPLSANQGKILQDNKLDKTANAVSASKLQAARTINSVIFDGTSDINIHPYYERVPGNADLNNYLNAGHYYCDYDAESATILNNPIGLSFSLVVEKAAGVIQRITGYRGISGIEYKRTYYEPHGWSAWDMVTSDLFPGRKIKTTSLQTNTDTSFIQQLTEDDRSGFFFDNGTGKYFSQFSTGVFSSLKTGSYFAIGAAPSDHKVKFMSGVVRDTGAIDLNQNGTLLDDYSRNAMQDGSDFNWVTHKAGGWASGLSYKATPEAGVYSGFGGFGGTDSFAHLYMAINGDAIWAKGNGKGLWLDDTEFYSNHKWRINGEVFVDSGSIHSPIPVSIVNSVYGSQKINTGGLLASDAYADTSKVPNNGIYAKGQIKSADSFYVDLNQATLQAASGRMLFVNQNDWGAWDFNTQTPVQLTMLYGGTGASTAAGARANLGLGNVDNTSDENKNVLSATKLSTASGSAPSYSARAFVNFNGQTGAINGSGNVSSITDNGVGNYRANFITDMPNSNYSTVGNVSHTDTGNESRSLVLSDTSLPTVNGVSFTTRYGGDNTVGKFDPQYVCLSIFG